MRRALAALALTALLIGAPARAEVKVDGAWMRPAAAGQSHAEVYADVAADEPLALVGASTPWAKRAELVIVDAPAADAVPRVVPSLPVGNGALRLAYLGSHVRLVDLLRDARPGERVPIELVFEGRDGRRRILVTEALVRGLGVRVPDAPR